MSDFIPPSGPPPPRVPDGWKAVWNQQYQEWFYVNTYTKESTWEKPTAPASGRDDSDLPPGAPPPSYAAGPNAPNISDTKKTPFESNNPYSQATGARETDEEMARRLQREEEERHRGGTSPLPGSTDRGASDSYYQNTTNSQQYPVSPGLQGGYPGGPSSSTYPQQTTTDTKRGSGGGFFGKLKDKLGGSQGSSGYPARPSGYGGYPQQGYPQQGYHQGYPQQGGYGQPMYGQQPMYGAQPARRTGGMGVGGAAALGVGGGLLGGMLLGEAMDGGDGGGDGDYGGGDGGDMGGGDMGGGGDF